MDYSEEDGNVRNRSALLSVSGVLLAGSLVLVAVGLLIVLVLRATDPIAASKRWMDGILALDGKTVMDRTCSEYLWVSNALNTGILLKDALGFVSMKDPGLLAIMETASSVGSFSGPLRIDRDGLRFDQIRVSDDEALVRVAGRMSLQIRDSFFAYDLDEQWKFVREQGVWRWCGPGSLPVRSPGPTP